VSERYTQPPAAAAAPERAEAPFALHPDADHADLAHWRANVGAPLALELAPPAPPFVRELDVLSWNVAIGSGDLAGLLAYLSSEGVLTPERPLVLLLQEALRADESVPELHLPGYHGGLMHRGERWSVGDFARAHALSLRYAPSMRNGAERSDRGNAVLATVALGSSHAFSLPYVRQHRVAVSATVQGLPGIAFVSAHLDTGGRARAAATPRRFGAGRALQARALAERLLHAEGAGDVLIGADLNTPLGRRDPALRPLLDAGLMPATPLGHWRHTFHGPVRLLLDHVLFHGRTHIERVEVTRIDERRRDRGRRIFGSDHHPLLARVTLRPEARGPLP
jgi:endonuclease/exonuclease/phosphatase family metal-dependent hydrolase